jgi:hypothetical protein
VVQPRQLPDGLLEVLFQGHKKPDYVLLEVATYPEKRLAEQALDDLMLAYQQFRVLPELLTLVLHPKGRFRVEGRSELQSRLGWSHLACRWKVVELWTLAAEDLLAANLVSLIPWVPLTQFRGPPEVVLEKCRDRIEQQAHPADQANLLAVSQVLAKLRYQDPQLLAILGGKGVMIESPLIKELMAERTQEVLVRFLQGRFGPVPLAMATQLRKIHSEKKLNDLIDHAARCPDLASFRERLFS